MANDPQVRTAPPQVRTGGSEVRTDELVVAGAAAIKVETVEGTNGEALLILAGRRIRLVGVETVEALHVATSRWLNDARNSRPRLGPGWNQFAGISGPPQSEPPAAPAGSRI
jgi:hypothetical protein